MRISLIAGFVFIVFALIGADVKAQTAPSSQNNTPAAQLNVQLRLKMVMDATNTDEIVIKLKKGASAKFVDSEDAQDMGGIDPEVSLSSFSSDNIPLAIDQIPYPGMQPDVIALLTDAANSGAYQLNRTQLLNLPPLYDVWLKDAFTGDSLNLRTDSICRFNIDKNNPATFGTKRFSVVFRENADSVLSLVSFAAEKNTSSALISWKVKNESDSTRFGVEKSIDTGKTFQPIGTVQANGSEIYSFADNKPATGQNQYRLKMQDGQGNSSYSNPLILLFQPMNAASNKIKLYPNPIVNSINLDIASDDDNLDMSPVSKQYTYNIKIVNSLGAVVKESVGQQANWHTDLSNLRPGSYHVQVTNNTDKSVVGTVNFIKN